MRPHASRSESLLSIRLSENRLQIFGTVPQINRAVIDTEAKSDQSHHDRNGSSIRNALGTQRVPGIFEVTRHGLDLELLQIGYFFRGLSDCRPRETDTLPRCELGYCLPRQA